MCLSVEQHIQRAACYCNVVRVQSLEATKLLLVYQMYDCFTLYQVIYKQSNLPKHIWQTMLGCAQCRNTLQYVYATLSTLVKPGGYTLLQPMKCSLGCYLVQAHRPIHHLKRKRIVQDTYDMLLCPCRLLQCQQTCQR